MFDLARNLAPLLYQAGNNVREWFGQVDHAPEIGGTGAEILGTLLPNTVEFRKFVQKQNARMGERDLARAGDKSRIALMI